MLAQFRFEKTLPQLLKIPKSLLTSLTGPRNTFVNDTSDTQMKDICFDVDYVKYFLHRDKLKRVVNKIQNMNVNENDSVHTHMQSVLTIKEIDDIPDVESNSSEFGESACGEPLRPQRLVVDFTPNDEDTDYVQKKCCAFWDFVTSCPELENFIVMPEPTISDRKSRTSDIELASFKTYEQQQEPAKSAVSMIEFVEEKGLITRAFEAKLPQSGCSVGSLDYFDEKPTVPRVVDKKICNCNNICKMCISKPSPERAKTSPEGVQNMCRELQDWDAQHPKCRPVCKSRRREWQGEVQHTSAELLLERKPLPECFRRWPTKVYPNSPCPLFGKTRHVTVKERGVIRPPTVVRICQAPVDDSVDTPYLKYAQLANRLGALDAVKACCAFCACGGCCACQPHDYRLHDADRAGSRRQDMRVFDARVKRDCEPMRIMYH